MGQIILACGLLQKTVTVIIILNKNSKAMSCTPDSDFFDIVAGVLSENTSEPYIFIICEDYVLRISKDQMKNHFTFKITRSRRYPTGKMTDTDYADNLTLLKNSSAQAEFLLHSQEQAVRDTDLNVNSNKIEFIF